MVKESTSLQDLFEMAKASTTEVEKGEAYLVKDLFRGFEWNRIPKGNRTKLGAMYLSFASNEGGSTVAKLGKTPQNQQKYEKK